MNIREIKASDSERIYQYLAEYPYKELQRRAQGLDKTLLSEYHRQRILAAAETNDSLIAFDAAHQVLGLAVIQPRPWHSKVFGVKMCKIAPFLLYKGKRAERSKFIKALLAKCRAQGYKHIELRVDVNEWEQVALLEQYGFHFVDCSIKMFINLESARLVLHRLPDRSFKVYRCRETHLPQLQEIARLSHQYNHFFADSFLNQERVRELFAQWVEKCWRELAYKMWVASRRDEILGFAIILTNPDFNQAVKQNIAVLDFIAVRPEVQGQGIGRWLLSEILIRLRRDEGFSQLELRTSINNYPALNLYATTGFHFIGADTIMSKNF